MSPHFQDLRGDLHGSARVWTALGPARSLTPAQAALAGGSCSAVYQEEIARVKGWNDGHGPDEGYRTGTESKERPGQPTATKGGTKFKHDPQSPGPVERGRCDSSSVREVVRWWDQARLLVRGPAGLLEHCSDWPVRRSREN
ncbi:hypothetical protein scyTo_0022878 [Scyliorhinus torazame]|uniref:Uncharacterized protein n=1 Tax=Scyliorhinus torazame TaxID=75743 RepID=A0A401QA12_SCYTO|nr:hypothetical protein [Scyliorhinus torazame]